MEAGKKRLATLVGCNYFNTRNELRGCINDVDSMRDLIVSRFGFEPEDVVVITDGPGSEVLPTGKNIRAALGSMVDKAEPGDVLFFHYSGHGTLVPAVKPHHGHGHSHSHSKRDEAIVPVDFNLITDVDLRQLVDGLPAGVSFTIISDSCHSGGLIDREKEQIGPNSAAPTDHRAPPRPSRRERTLPHEVILQHLSSLSAVESEHVGDHLLDIFGDDASAKFSRGSQLVPSPKPVDDDDDDDDDGILLSGCQTDETSADVGPDEEGGDGKAYGAFSNSVKLVLQEGRILSNREVVLRARKLLREQDLEQHPCLYCSDENADAPFLWQQGDRSSIASSLQLL